MPDVLAPPVVAPASARKYLELTIYADGSGEGYAFVREARSVRVPAGRFVLSAPDIASDLVAETTRFRLLSNDEEGNEQLAAELYEQQYLYDRLTPQRLLEKSEGKQITAVWWAGLRKGRERSLTGTLVSSTKGVVLKLDSGEVVPLDQNVRLSLSALPTDLVTEPTLKWNVGSFEAANATLQLSYRANRFTWSADYIVMVNKDASKAHVEGWVSVENQGETTFEKAKLQLIAGKVNTVMPPEEFDAQPAFAAKALAMEDRDRTRANEETLGDLHLYTIEHPTTLPAHSSKQVRFVLAHDVPLTLVAETTIDVRTGSFPALLLARLDNKKKGPLGVPLPAGTARTNMQSSAGTAIQVGEGPVKHTPSGEPWRIPISDAENQLTSIRLDDKKLIGRNPAGETVIRYTLTLRLSNAAERTRLRRVVFDPGFRRIIGLPEGSGATLEGPKRLVLETKLNAGQTKSYRMVVDVAEPARVPKFHGEVRR